MKKKKMILLLVVILAGIAGITVYSINKNQHIKQKEEIVEDETVNETEEIIDDAVIKYDYTLASPLSSKYQTMIDEWIDTNITNDMTTMEKVNQVIDYVTSMPYNYDYWCCEDMLEHSQGECWASTDLILHILERIGIPVGIRTRNNTLAYPDYHIENYVMIDGTCYILNCGTNTVVPREYKLEPITNPYTYSIKDDGTIMITDYDYYSTYVEVPESIDGYVVSEIAAYAYCNHYEMVSVEIPDYITVDSYAFNQCTSLSNIQVCANTIIEENAFYLEKTTYLGDDKLWIPDGITDKFIYSKCSS